MAKKKQDTSKKKVKSNSSKDESILGEINARLKLGQKELQKQVDELTSQVKTLTKDSGNSARKLLNTIEKNYHKKVADLHKDFDKRMESVHKFQDKFIAQLPTELAEKLHLKASSAAEPAKKSAETATNPKAKVSKQKAAKTKAKTIPKKTKAATVAKTTKAKTAPKAAKAKTAKATAAKATKATTAKAKTSKATAAKATKATTAKAKTAKATAAKATKATTAKATTAKATTSKAKVLKAPTISSINGIGPVIHKKLTEAGITTLEDLANTPKNKTEALKQFEKTRGFSSWQKEAQALLTKK